MAALGCTFAEVKRHFENRISHTAGLIQAPGVLVKTGSMNLEQQTFVKNAVWGDHPQRGSGGTQAAHVVAGGIYVMHRPCDRRFRHLLREGQREDKHGYLLTPICDAAVSSQGRQLIYSQMTATTVLPTVVNRIDLAAEGTRGNQLPLTAGEKRALEIAVSSMKMTGRGRSFADISLFAIKLTSDVCVAADCKLAARDVDLKRLESQTMGSEREYIQLQRELIDLKRSVLHHPEKALDWGRLFREADLLREYELDGIRAESRAVQDTVDSYRAEEESSRKTSSIDDSSTKPA